jgi:hypothetical protein
MNGFSVRKQDYSQILFIHFVDLGPAANSPVFLYHFANRMLDRPQNPLLPDCGAIRSRAHRQEVRGKFHWRSLPGDIAHCKQELWCLLGVTGSKTSFSVQLVNPNLATPAPARARVLEKLKKNAWVEIKIHEGRNRGVRRMFEALGYFVEKLIRVRIGNVELGRIAPGEIRPLMRTEIIKLKRTIRFEDSRSEPEKRKRAGSRR